MHTIACDWKGTPTVLSRLFALILLGLLCVVAAFGADEPLPAPPLTFSWHHPENGLGAFLRPDGWFVKEESGNGTNALFISREDIESVGRFVVGLTVNEITGISARRNAKPSVFARSYIKQLAREREVLKSGVVKGSGGTPDMHVARVKSINAGVPTIVHHIAVGNDANDSAYIIIFEAPASEWDEAMKIGAPMLNAFLLR